MKLSRGFVCALFGVAMTPLGWFGPWAWPVAPGFFVLYQFFGGSYDRYAPTQRAMVILLLIVVNSGTWAVVFWSAAALLPLFLSRQKR